MTDSKHDEPDLTIVGGQPHDKRRRHFRGKVQVPVGLEKALFHAASDDVFKTRLLADPRAAIEEAGIHLRPSELAMIAAVSSAALEDMIDKVVPANPKKRKFMGLVANATASLAAGTVLAGCGEETSLGSRPDDSTTDGGSTGTDADDGVTGTDEGGTQTATGTATGTNTGTASTATGTATGTGTGTGTGTPTATGTDTDTVETTNSDTQQDGGVGPDVGGY